MNYNEIEATYKQQMLSGQLNTLAAEIKQLADPGIKGFKGKDLYYLAARYLDYETISYLHTSGIKPRDDARENNAFHALVQSPRLNQTGECINEAIAQTTTALLRAGVNPKAKNEENEIPLFIAAQEFLHPFFAALVQANIPLDATDNRKRNLLQTILADLKAPGKPATRRNDAIETIKTLVNAQGVDLTTKDASGYDTVYYVKQLADEEITALFGDISTPEERELAAYEKERAFWRKLEDGTPEEFLSLIKDCPGEYTTMPDYLTRERNVTPLHLAARRAIPAAISCLLNEGLAADLATSNGTTPLMWVAGNFLQPEHVRECALLLLNAGADPHKKDNYDKTPVLIAAQAHNVPFLALLCEKNIPLTQTDEEGNNALMFALTSVDAQYAFYIRGRKAQIFHPSELSYSQYLPTVEKAVPTVRLLLDAGVDPEGKTDKGITPLDLAFVCEAKKLRAMMKGLITGNPAQADEEQQLAATGGMTLNEAVWQRDAEAVRAIIETGLHDINTPDHIIYPPDSDYDPDWMPPYGEGTPLGQACLLFYPEMITLLLELGADPNYKDNNGRTALSWLFFRNRRLYHRYFRENIPAQVIARFAEAGADLNANVDDRYESILSLACSSVFGDYYPADTRPGQVLDLYDGYVVRDTFHILVINALLEKEVDVNHANIDGRTPLMATCMGNYGFFPLSDEVAVKLLEKGASVSARDNYGNTPLIYAAVNEEMAMATEMAARLFKYGDPLPQAVNTEGKSALDYAVTRQNEPLIKLLVDKTQ